MQKNVYIYNEDLELIAQPFVDTIENFNSNPELYFPNWAVNMYVSETKFEYPILDGDTLRDMTKEEKIIQLGMEELLEDGEYIQDEKLIVVEYDESLGYYKKAWNKEAHVWYEGTTHEEFVKMRADKILEYSQLEENKKSLENSKFSTQEEIQLIIEKMQELESEINKIADKVKSL